MKNSRNERLSEHLLNVDEDILANAYEVDNSKKLRMYKKTKNEKKKPIYITPVFRRVAAFAACLLLIVGVALHVPTIFFPDSSDIGQLSTGGDNSDTGNDNMQKGPYIVADSDDDYGIELEDLKSREERYISNALLEKMQTYRGTNAVYKVIVEIIITGEDINEFSADEEDEELLLLYDQFVKASEDYEGALAKLVGVDEGREELYEQLEIEEKEKIKKELSRKYDECLRKLEDEYYGKIANTRLEYATELSETAPVLITEESGVYIYAAYKSEYAFFMDLSADDINELAGKGGYVFRLASAANEAMDRFEQE